jgi:hypothetical protein
MALASSTSSNIPGELKQTLYLPSYCADDTIPISCLTRITNCTFGNSAGLVGTFAALPSLPAPSGGIVAGDKGGGGGVG